MSEWFFRGDYNIIQNNKSSIHNSLKNIRDDIYVGLHKNDQDIQEEFSLLLDVNNLKFISLDDLLGSIVLLEKIGFEDTKKHIKEIINNYLESNLLTQDPRYLYETMLPKLDYCKNHDNYNFIKVFIDLVGCKIKKMDKIEKDAELKEIINNTEDNVLEIIKLIIQSDPFSYKNMVLVDLFLKKSEKIAVIKLINDLKEYSINSKDVPDRFKTARLLRSAYNIFMGKEKLNAKAFNTWQKAIMEITNSNGSIGEIQAKEVYGYWNQE